MRLERIAIVPAPSTAVAQFGVVTAVYGNTMVVSALNIGISDETECFVYFYQRNNGGTWELKQTVAATDVTDKTGVIAFGTSLAIYENYVVIGQSNTNTDPGEVHIFIRGNDGTWTFKETLTGDDNDDKYGAACSIYGNNLLVGAYQGTNAAAAQTGAAYWYCRGNDGTFKRVYKRLGEDNTSQYGGRNVSLSGNYAAVSANALDTPGRTASGRIYLYTRDNNGDWEEVGTDDGTANNMFFGISGVNVYKNFVVTSSNQAGGGAGILVTGNRNNSGEWKRAHVIEGSSGAEALGGASGLYGNFVYSITGQDPADNNNCLLTLYNRDSEGNLEVIGTATFPTTAATINPWGSDIHGNYIVVGAEQDQEVFVYQYKN